MVKNIQEAQKLLREVSNLLNSTLRYQRLNKELKDKISEVKVKANILLNELEGIERDIVR